MPRNRVWSPLQGLQRVGWYGGDPWNVTNRSNGRYWNTALHTFPGESKVVLADHLEQPPPAYSFKLHRKTEQAGGLFGSHKARYRGLAPLRLTMEARNWGCNFSRSALFFHHESHNH